MQESIRHPYVPASMVVVLTWLLCVVAGGCNAIADGFGIEPVADSTGPIVSLLERMDQRADANHKATIEALAALKPSDGYKRAESAWPDAEPQPVEPKHDATAVAVQELVAEVRAEREAMRAAAEAAKFTGAKVYVSDPAATLAGTSSCVPCNWLVSAIRTVEGWTVGVESTNHFVLVQSANLNTPTVIFYRDGKEAERYEGFDVGAYRRGDLRERNTILSKHPKAVRQTSNVSPAYKSREPNQAPGTVRADWPDADPQPNPIADGGGCAGPGCAGPQFAAGCEGGYQMRAPAVAVRTWFAAPVRRMVCDPVTGVCW